MKNGWHEVSRRTRIHIEGDQPTKVETTAYDLDTALDDAAQFFGEPLERTGQWLTDAGRDPEHEDTGNNSRVTASVATSASVHEDAPRKTGTETRLRRKA